MLDDDEVHDKIHDELRVDMEDEYDVLEVTSLLDQMLIIIDDDEVEDIIEKIDEADVSEYLLLVIHLIVDII